MSRGNSVFIVGPMGSGKSSAGRKLAARLNFEFLDSDQEIERQAGVDINWIFDIEKEEGFRARESRIIDQLTQKALTTDLVLATGGGVVLAEANRGFLRERGIVVYLHASVAEQYRRVKYSKSRPLLQTDDPQGALRALFEQREPLYREVADIVVNTDGNRPQAVAKAMHQRVARMLAAPPASLANQGLPQGSAIGTGSRGSDR